MISFDEITNKKKLNFIEVDLDQAAIYSGEDVYMTAQLYNNQQESRKDPILQAMELPLIPVITQVELD
jgi:DNA polymerase I-like protein with 3'-5' exonuclease and polymerase domains